MRDITPQDWRNVGDVVAAHDSHPERPDPVLDAFVAAAFRREIPWPKDTSGHPTAYTKTGRLRSGSMSRFMRVCADRASTPGELAALFDAFDHAWANGMAGATGSAGGVLLERAERDASRQPLPQGWRSAADWEVLHNGGRSGAYWAFHMMHAADMKFGGGPDRGGREIA